MLLDACARLKRSLIPQTAQEMCDHLELTLCEISQLYVETRRMRCSASPPLDCLQGFMCLLGYLGIAPLLDMVKLVDRPLGDEA